MEILILGGTALLGRAIAEAALHDGHEVTCAARGTARAPEAARFVAVDRDDDHGVAALTDRTWGAVVDVSRHPGQVRRAVRDLRARHWVFISTLNVYAAFDRLEQTEDAALVAPLDGDVLEDMAQYGAAKVACEDIMRANGAPATIIRSGLIGGAGDATGRSGYYPWRFAHPTGSDVLVPGDFTFPCALIDVEDLAAWVVHAATTGLDGTFNATGPTVPLGEVLAAAARVSGSAATPRPVAADALREHGIAPWMGSPSLPLWIDDPTWRFFATADTSAARRAGLTLRPLDDTLAAALVWENAREGARPAGLTDAQERDLRVALDGDV